MSITPLVKPNALLLVGRPENVRMAIELVQRLDVPVAPATRFEVFPLKNASAADAKTMIDQFLDQEEQEEEQQQAAATAAADARHAGAGGGRRADQFADRQRAPRDLAEIAALVAKIDSPSGAAVDQVRVFPLRERRGHEMAGVLRGARFKVRPTEGEDEGGHRPRHRVPRPSNSATSATMRREN